jgi:hypothetical protein
MNTFINFIRKIFNATIVPILYPDYIQDQKRLGNFENSLSNLERGVTINRIESSERLYKSVRDETPLTIVELVGSLFSSSDKQS